MPDAPPNVLLITADQMRRDHLGCYGNPVVRTPHLDALAGSGTRIDRAYVSNPLCMPNRSTMATGRFPRNHGCWSNGICLPETERTVADVLNERGYHTALLGKAHFNSYGNPADAQAPNCESRRAWDEKRITADWNGPYYGFQEAVLSLGHGNWGMAGGHYGEYLQRSFPQLVAETKQKPSPTGAPQCYTPIMPVEAHCSHWLGTVGCDYLRRRADDGRPFFCWLSFPDPHHPFCPPEPYDTMHDPGDVVLPRLGPEALADKPPHFREAHEGGQTWEGIGAGDVAADVTEDQLREIIARTYGMISLIDENVGRVLEVLDRSGLAGNTVVIFTSDHGDLMGDCGLMYKGPFLLEGLIGVPMIWRVPGAGGGTAPAGLMSTVDIAPTMLRLLGADVPAWMDSAGEPALARGEASTRDAAFVEFRSMYRPHLDLRSIITRDARLTHYAGLETGELYDLTADAPEARNLYDDASRAELRGALERRLLDECILRADRRHAPTCHA